MTDRILVFCTCADSDEAGRIAAHVVESRLAACVTIFPQIRSIYRWKGRIEDASEVLLLMKSTRSRFDALRAAIEHAHSYDTPEILAVPVEAGAEAYLRWIGDETEGASQWPSR